MNKFMKVMSAVILTLDLFTLLTWGVAIVVSMTGNLYGTWKYSVVMNGMLLGFAFLLTSMALFICLALSELIRPSAHSAT